MKIQKNNLPQKLNEEYTNEFVLLGLFYYAQKNGFKLGRMQTSKLIWKFKDVTQKKLKLQAYYLEPYKDKHGRFNKKIYDQLNNLKTAGFVETVGITPYESFIITAKGQKLFSRFNIENSKVQYALQLVKANLEHIVKENGQKPALLLREEDHKDIKEIDKMPIRDENLTLLPNLKEGQIEHQFLFDYQTTLDWGVAIGLGERKKTEEIIPNELLPKNQEEMYKVLGL